MKLSDYLISAIAERGGRHVFFVPGGAAMHLNNSLAEYPDVGYVANLHEQASAIAAEAYARVTNGLGVCMVTAGPGATNAVTGVAGAWLDSTPVIFLSGQVKRADLKGSSGLRMFGVQEVDIVSIVRPITKYAVTIVDPLEARYHLERALHLALTGRRGPVWLDLPLDVQAAQIEPATLRGYDPAEDAGASPDDVPARVTDMLALLSTARRPVIVAGNGIRAAGAIDVLAELVSALNIPVLPTCLGLDLLPESHPLMIGRPGSLAPRGANFALQNCDLLLCIGSRMDMALTAYAHDRLARGARKVMVDIDPAEIAKMKMTIDLKVVADAGAFLREALRQVRDAAVSPAPWAEWVERCTAWKQRYPVVLPEHHQRSDYVSTYAFSAVLSDVLDEGEVIATGSSGAGIEVFILAFQVKSGQRIFHNRGLGSMGFGLPAAIGACLASGRARTICVDGDGGFLFNIQELETVARLKLPIKFFILDNAGYASIRTSQNRYFGRTVGADPASGMTLPDIGRVANAFGIQTARIAGGDDLRARILEVLAMDGPVVCCVMTPPDEPRQPSVVSIQRADGSMVSKPLEDLWPFLDREEFKANMIVAPIEE